MALVASVNYVSPPRITLTADTKDADLDTTLVYREVVALRIANAAHRQYPPIIEAGGNLEKVPNVSSTLPYVRLLNGCRIIPHNSSHGIRLIRDTFTDDGESGRDCFDRTSLSVGVNVDIDVDIQEVEVRVVTTTGDSVVTGDIDQIAGLVFAAMIDGSTTFAESVRLQNSVLAGKVSGAGTGTETFRSLADDKDRVVVTTDVDGNRTAVVRDGS